MKKIIFTLLTFLTTSLIFAQDRVNVQTPEINLSVGSQLLSANGWMLNPEGQWIYRKNRIPIYIENEYKSLIDYGTKGLGLDHFISYQLKEITIDSQIYSILIKKEKNIRYQYPYIREGMYITFSYRYFVIDKKEFNDSIKTIINNEITSIKLKCKFSGVVGNYLTNQKQPYKTDIEKDIIKNILNPDASQYTYDDYLILHIKPNKEKNQVRFLIYGYHGNVRGGGFTSGINHHECSEPNNNYSYWENLLSNLNKGIFDRCYFETDYITFNTFINLSI
jgi:hypothetical protein